MTPITRTSALETEMTSALISLVNSLDHSAEDYSIISVTDTGIAIVDFDGETKLIPVELVVELSTKATISYEDSFSLIATLVSKRNPGDMAVEIILPLLENRQIEEVKDILIEYGDSDTAYLVETITVDETVADIDDDVEDILPFFHINDLKDTITAEINICKQELTIIQQMLNDAPTVSHKEKLSKELSCVKKQIKELRNSLKEL